LTYKVLQCVLTSTDNKLSGTLMTLKDKIKVQWGMCRVHSARAQWVPREDCSWNSVFAIWKKHNVTHLTTFVCWCALAKTQKNQ